jgi:non-homologous end joining protein Ku
MKLNDVKIGQRVFTRVGDKRVEVEVIELVKRLTYGTRSGRNRLQTKVRVRRVDNGLVLPKLRGPKELHIEDGRDGSWPSMTQPQNKLHILFAKKMLDELREALKSGTASDPQYCLGLIELIEYKIENGEVTK